MEPDEQALLARALEGAANAIMITDSGGRIAWVNQAFCRLSGYSRDEAIGNNPRLLSSGAQGPDFYRAMWEMILQGRSWQGELVERRRDGSIYTVSQVISPLLDAQGQPTHFLAIQQDMGDGASERTRIRRLAYYDALTDLPNRVLFLQLLAEAIAQSALHRRRAAVMFLDLDRFKGVNDSFGHATGDQLLRAVADRIRACVRRSDTVARLSGDEFVILLRDLEGSQPAEALALKLIDSIALPYFLDGLRVTAGASIGISIYPEDGQQAEELVARADAAMYEAKTQGRGTYRFASAEGSPRR